MSLCSGLRIYDVLMNNILVEYEYYLGEICLTLGDKFLLQKCLKTVKTFIFVN